MQDEGTELNESPLWRVQNGPCPQGAGKAQVTCCGQSERMALDRGDQEGFWEGGALSTALQVKMGEGVYSRQIKHGWGHVSKWGAQLRDVKRRGGAWGWKVGKGLKCHITKYRPHMPPLGQTHIQSGDNSYPIHRDVGPVVDSTEGWRERCWVAAVLRKCCSVQHKPEILVRKGCKKISLLPFILREYGHPWSIRKWCY